MFDFTLIIYQDLLKRLAEKYPFQTFEAFIKEPKEKVVILRHDVDKLPDNSLIFAEIENRLGINGTYYFRIVPQSFNEVIIKKISLLGHEIGYHYEDVSISSKVHHKLTEEDLVKKSIISFKTNLEKIRTIVPIKSICMHGSPLSKWDNRVLWKYFDYRDFDLIGEPYFDINFNSVLYLTDTGRNWNSESNNFRDRPLEKLMKESDGRKLSKLLNSTRDIIYYLDKERLPDKIMINLHPQRWSNDPITWIREYFGQKMKNSIKSCISYYSNIR